MTSNPDASTAGLPGSAPQPLSAGGRYLIVVTAFLGWMFAGVQMSITALAMRSAAIDLLQSTNEALVGKWFAWYVCAFLFGAAAGGWLFGRLGDRFGRVRGMGWSILCLSVFPAWPIGLKVPSSCWSYDF